MIIEKDCLDCKHSYVEDLYNELVCKLHGYIGDEHVCEKCKNCKDFTIDELALKAEIRRVNEILRNKPNPHTYRQHKKYLERLERKLRQCQKTKN